MPTGASLHFAMAGVGIGVVGENASHGLVGDPPFGVLADHPQVVVLHRVVVAVELEVAAHRLEALGFQGFSQALLILDLALTSRTAASIRSAVS